MSGSSDSEKPEASAADGAEKPEASAADGAEKPVNKCLRYKEVEGDLFQCPDTSSLANCVSKDLCMSKGIATIFKRNFGRVNELKRQDCTPEVDQLKCCGNNKSRKKNEFNSPNNFGTIMNLLKVTDAKNVGECAVLQFPDRYIYYLITKKVYSHKPTYADLEASLVQMKEHCQANGVKELSMPQIACGLDRLVWKRVSAIIQKVFADVDISITIYVFINTRR